MFYFQYLDILLDIFLFIYLIYCTVSDIKHRSISLSVCIFFFIPLLSLKLILYSASPSIMYSATNCIIGSLPGLALIGISIFTHGSIGIGDGIIILICGVAVGISEILSLLITSLIISSIFSIVMIIRKRSFSYSFPFAPFIFMGFIILLIDTYIY